MGKFKIGDIVTCMYEMPTSHGVIRVGDVGRVAENSSWPFVFWARNVGGHDMHGQCPEGHCWALNENLLKLKPVILENK